MCHICLANILFWLLFAHCQNFWLCNGIFYFLSYLVFFMQALHRMKDITLASHILCTHFASQSDDWFHTQTYVKSQKFHFLISLFVPTHWAGNILCLFFTIIRPLSQTNSTKHMAKNKHTSSLIYGSVTYDFHYKCLFRIHLSMLWLVFPNQGLTYVFPGSTDKNHYFPPLPPLVLPHKRDKIRNIHVNTS